MAVDGLSAVEAALGFTWGERIEACRPPYGKLAPGPCPHPGHKLRRLRSKAVAHRPPSVGARRGGYVGPQFKVSVAKQARWDDALGAAVTSESTDTSISPAERGAARHAAADFRERLTSVEQRRFDQETSIAGRQDAWRRSAPAGGQDSTGLMRERMRAALRDSWGGKKIAMRVTPQDLDQVLDDGRFKTSHETARSGGFHNPKAREDLEQQVFGIDPADPDLEGRPVYGYVAVNGIRRQGLDSALGQYGSVQVVLKDSVRRRTTASVGDSMARRSSARPSPVDAPQHWSYNVGGQPAGQYRVDGEKLAHSSYVEAQVHGGVTTGDIEEVVFARQPEEGLVAKLAERGIPWRIVN